MKTFFSFLLFNSIIFGNVLAQYQLDCIDNLPTEKIVLDLDRNLYIAGEKIWFTAYCLENGNLHNRISKVLYLELFNGEKKAFIQQKFKITNGMAFGHLDIPEQIGTGHYFLRAYTNYLRNFSADYATFELISIVNPLVDSKDIGEPEMQKTSSLPVTKTTTLPVEIQLSKKRFKAREKVVIQLNPNIDKSAKLNITVRKKGLHQANTITKITQQNPWLSNADQTFVKTKQLEWLPETRALSINGIVVDSETKKPIANELCMVSVIGETTQLHLTETKDDGSFLFSLKGLEGKQNLFVGLKNRTKKNMEVLVKNDFSTSFPSINQFAFSYDSTQHQIIEELYLNHQIGSAYTFENQYASFELPMNNNFSRNIAQANTSIDVTSFIQVPTMEEVFRELVPAVNVKGKIGDRYLSMINDELFQTFDDPIVLLDNVPIYNIEKLLEINPKKIKKIDLINSYYLLGDFMVGGILSIKTNTDNFAKYQWENETAFVEYKTISPSTSLRSPNYNNAATKGSTKADFRTILYWNPIVDLRSTSFEFYTSDHLSEYEIIIRGMTIDGQPYFGKTDFNVVNSLK